jgi:hypothetical protein
MRVPSENTIAVDGTIPLDKVKSAMTSLDTNTFTISLIQDLFPNDGIKTAIASPPLTGKVIVTSDDGVKQKIIDFNIQNARTECKFITLAKAIGPANSKNTAAIGQLGKVNTGNVKIPDNNKLVAGIGSFVLPINPIPNNPFPQALNPPFATCQNPTVTVSASGVPTVDPTTNTNKDSLALYNIRGTISDLSQISGRSLTILVNTDLVFADTDHATLINGNNPLINVNIISNADKNTAHKIGFTISDLWTDCKAVNANTQDEFRVLPGEIAP